MTPQEKAKALVESYRKYVAGHPRGVAEKDNAKQCAIIAVEEILIDKKVGYSKDIIEEKQYWQNVKTEILNL